MPTPLKRWNLYKPNAKAAIEAMREPTDEMIAAAPLLMDTDGNGIPQLWKIAIDAALKEE